MLLDFYFENFRSIFDKSAISMQKGLKRELEETLINKKVNRKEYTLLPNKIIYGVNAAGKTSIILAMQVLKEIVINGSIYSSKDKNILNNLPIYRFLHDKDKLVKPMTLGISFLFKNRKFEYELKIGTKDEDIFEMFVFYEKLIVDDITIFERKNNKFKFNSKNNSKFKKYVDMTASYLKETEKVLEKNINGDIVFTKWFNYNKEILSDFLEWITSYLEIYKTVDNIKYTSKINSKDKLAVSLNNAIKKMTKEADFGPQRIEFVENKISETQIQTYLESYYNIKGITEYDIMAESDITESLGTLKLIKFLAPFITTILTGGVIVIDELDSSIHPEVIASIISTFNDPLVNVNGGQLIFTTHNPVFLNKNLLRRDEIVFVEKDPNTYISEISTLDDFDTRIDKNYLKNYLEGKYINFANINFSSIIKETIGSIEKSDEKES